MSELAVLDETNIESKLYLNKCDTSLENWFVMNLFFEEPTSNILSSALFYGWKSGLKTGTYYVRSQPKVQAQQFTVDPRLKRKVKKSNDDELKMNIMDNGNKSELTEAEKCARDNPGACDFCSG